MNTFDNEELTEISLADIISEMEEYGIGMVSGEYVGKISRKIAKDVLEELRLNQSSKITENDISLAVGRVLCKKLGIDA